MHNHADLYRTLYRMRRFEQTVLDEFSSGVFYGTTHTYIGQEANAVGVLSHIKDGDIVFSNHRCHGHFIAYGGDMQALYEEMMGKPGGVSAGRGGSQHIHWKDFYSNGILGSTIPIATGTALAEKLQGRNALTIAYLGDGALGEGAVYESLNMAALWGAPILYVVENNKIAQTTPADIAIAGSIPARFEAFDIPIHELDSSDVLEILPIAETLLNEIRSTQTPRALILNTCRFAAHSKSDDTRDEADLTEMRETRDPLTIHMSRVDIEERESIETEEDAAVAAAFAGAKAAPVWEGQS